MGRKNELGYDVIHIPVERPVGLPVVPHTKQYKFLENKGRLGPGDRQPLLIFFDGKRLRPLFWAAAAGWLAWVRRIHSAFPATW